MRVLVIEDDVDLRQAIASEIADAGHEVLTACDGAAAWEALSTQPSPPDVILLDLMMPNMDGQAFRVRQLGDSRLAHVPTLVMTAKTVDLRTRSALGGVPILPKPFASEVLLAALDEVAQERRPEKQCGCGRVYDDKTWAALPFVAEMDNGREVGERLELRRCSCRSTLAWQIGSHALSVPSLRIRR
jgi:DNA-binding response OmpR family regulator